MCKYGLSAQGRISSPLVSAYNAPLERNIFRTGVRQKTLEWDDLEIKKLNEHSATIMLERQFVKTRSLDYTVNFHEGEGSPDGKSQRCPTNSGQQYECIRTNENDLEQKSYAMLSYIGELACLHVQFSTCLVWAAMHSVLGRRKKSSNWGNEGPTYSRSTPLTVVLSVQSSSIMEINFLFKHFRFPELL